MENPYILNSVIDPLEGLRFALSGQIVTMDDTFTVLKHGVIYIDQGRIISVQPAGTSPPAGFEHIRILETGGTIYPGLIELHNHLSYNILSLWSVPQQYTNRSQWGGTPEYRKQISGPMAVLGRTQGNVEAIVRYVECKCLLGGVTTSQGISLFSNNGIRKYYRGIVRNVEETGDLELPGAASKVSDVELRDVSKFMERLKRCSCLLLHLSEGIDQVARNHFYALRLPDSTWAITPALVGIHSAALTREDFNILGQHGASMVWSPLSNLLLYGKTADIRGATEAGVNITLGSDWSPSGSKNLLWELKVARLVSQESGHLFTNRDLLAMATRNPARALGWTRQLGSLEPDKRADLLVLSGSAGDPYDRIFTATEKSIRLVVINGIPRYGTVGLMNKLGGGTERWKVGRSPRILNLHQPTGDLIVGELSLLQAATRIADGLQHLPELAAVLEKPKPVSALESGSDLTPEWFLDLENNPLESDTGILNSRALSPEEILLDPSLNFELMAPAAPLSQILAPIALDPLTVVDDFEYLLKLERQYNLPMYIKRGLMKAYSG